MSFKPPPYDRNARYVVASNQSFKQPRQYQVCDSVNAARYILITTDRDEAYTLCAKLNAED